MLQVLFHVAPPGDLIDVWTGLRGFNHVELWFQDGQSFSSTTEPVYDMNGVKVLPDGVRFKDRSADYAKLSEWRSAIVTRDEESEAKVRAYAETLAGKHRYDYFGILHFVLPIIPEHPQDYFCSEVCVEALQQIGLFEGLLPCNVSPNDMADSFGVKK